jgi:uncharacterized repeat protein (TIGR01451 family)
MYYVSCLNLLVEAPVCSWLHGFKSSDVPSVAHGGTVTYTFLVTYDSSDGAPATDVSVSDPICDAAPVLVSGDSDGDGLLDEGETWEFICELTVPAHTACWTRARPGNSSAN